MLEKQKGKGRTQGNYREYWLPARKDQRDQNTGPGDLKRARNRHGKQEEAVWFGRLHWVDCTVPGTRMARTSTIEPVCLHWPFQKLEPQGSGKAFKCYLFQRTVSSKDSNDERFPKLLRVVVLRHV